MLIVLFPAVAFFSYTAIFMVYKGKEFMEYKLTQYQKIMPAKDYTKLLADFQENADRYTHPVFQGSIMFITLFAVGFIVALLATWWISRRTK